MITTVIYSAVLEAVESEIPLSKGWINGSKTEDATDARYILCGYLHMYGMSSSQIQAMTLLTKTSVNKFLAGLNTRIARRKITRIWWQQIGNKLATKHGDDVGLGEYFRSDQINIFSNQQK